MKKKNCERPLVMAPPGCTAHTLRSSSGMEGNIGMRPLAVASWWVFNVGSGWLLLCPGVLWIVPVISGWTARTLHDTSVINGMVYHHRIAVALYPKTQLKIEE